MNETDYNARLYEKMKAEQDKYRDRLLSLRIHDAGGHRNGRSRRLWKCHNLRR